DPETNDRVRGAGSFSRAVAAIVRLNDRGLLPIVTATEIASAEHPGVGMYERFRDFLIARGIEKPRVKIMPVFALGRLGREGDPRLTEADLAGFDRGLLQCSESRVLGIQGNYDEALAQGKTDCGCGYTDPRDNHFARISYEYTFANTSTENNRWLGGLPARRHLRLGTLRVLMSHGSPRVINEFLW